MEHVPLSGLLTEPTSQALIPPCMRIYSSEACIHKEGAKMLTVIYMDVLQSITRTTID